MSELNAIPTNVITGFLGVGKSTAIMQLFKQKPAHERWAVLVNEFGEVGVDGSLFQGEGAGEKDIFIREVPGGCMCCAAGLPMQIALNMLLARAKPQRLLIEPTGLGHPKEVLDVLQAEHYRSVLDLRATITLVDARKVQQPRYTDNNTFNQQLEIADVIVANKADQYQAGDFPALLAYLEGKQFGGNKNIQQSTMGKLQYQWLAPVTAYEERSHHHHEATDSYQPEPELPECGYMAKKNQGEGFCSQGWIFRADFVFNRDRLYGELTGIVAERVKGVFITDQGVFAYNKVDDVLTEYEIDDSMDSRVECIAVDDQLLLGLESKFLACIEERGS